MRSDIDRSLAAAISGRALLDHPFYRRWTEGGLTADELAAYAEQYRHFERTLPEVLATTAECLPDGVGRDYVAANLADEQSRPQPHVELFEQFATAVGASPDVPPSPATKNLIEVYRSAAEDGPVQALSVIGAYELQAADIAATKAASLRRHYDLDKNATAFWDVHAELERDHAGWTVEALAALGEPGATIDEYAVASANAWWNFLDERNSMAQSLAG